MTLRIAVCDDERIITDDITKRLLQYNQEYEIEVYHSGKALLEVRKEYDMIFLDIEMPEMNGMEVATALRNETYEGCIVFLTSHTEFMQDAFKVKAFRFLKKPIMDADFEETVKEAEKEIVNNKKITVQTSDSVHMLNIRDIIYIETAHNNSYIYTIQGELETRKTLHDWMEILGEEHFYQVHRSYAISFRHIDKIDKKGVWMKYVNVSIPVSRRKYSELRERFFSYVKKYASAI